MVRVVVLCLMLVGLAAADPSLTVGSHPNIEGSPYIVPSQGKVWPKPQQVTTDDTFLSIAPASFKFVVGDQTCDFLTKAMARAIAVMFPKKTLWKGRKTGGQLRGSLTTVTVTLSAPCEALPYLHMDESYEIEVSAADATAAITSASIWGAIHGLESFTHLVMPDGAGAYKVFNNAIKDFPRFAHRGFMIDTSRHFLPLDSITEMVDLMSFNKFNVLHWHVVDSESFPYQSAIYPDLSAKGAWTDRHLYTEADITEVVNYAAERAVRVMPEFDTPGHTGSWGPGQPGLLTPCYSGGVPNGGYGPIDPSYAPNYEFLSTLFKEVAERFPEHYLHLGGDEVSFSCWQSNPNITAFMKEQGIAGDYAALEQYYISKLLALVSALPTKNGYIVWQEVFDNGVKLADDTVVEIWKDSGDGLKLELARVTAAGYQTLLSSCWYLNYISYGANWGVYYNCDPQDFDGTDAQKALIVGGEACMWGEYVDKTNVIPFSWPLGSAVGEKLWSAADATTDTGEAAPRLEEQRCRMLARGHDVRPLGPSYCDADIP